MIDAILGLEGQVQRAVIAALLVALALAIIAGGAGTLYYRAEAAEAREELTRCAGDLALERANVKGLKDAIGVQNGAVEALESTAQAALAESAAAREAAALAAAEAQRRAGDIQARPPSDPSDMCRSALDLYEWAAAKRRAP